MRPDAYTSLMQTLDYSHQYRIWHNETEEHAQLQVERLEQLYSTLLPAASDQPVVDIGCGMGFAMRWLSKAGFTDVEGIDIDESQVHCCQQNGLRVQLSRDSIAYLRQRPQHYQLILMLDVLEHVQKDQQVPLLRAAFDSLVPHGQIIISVPNANSPIAVRWLYADYTHHNSFTETSLRFVLLNSRFSAIRITSSDPVCGLRQVCSPARLITLLWNRSRRRRFKQAFVRWMWKQVLSAELPGDISRIPLGRNLHAVAFKK